MLIVNDKRLSREAKEKLAAYGELLELETRGITYPAISGHPDIFFGQLPGRLVVAPILPEHYIQTLNGYDIDYILGELPVGQSYPETARYNAVATGDYFIHNLNHTDPGLLRAASGLQPIQVGQGYTRCNLLPLKGGHFITCDPGIYKALQGRSPSPKGRSPCVINVDPSGILLEGFPHGFFGGCCGVMEDEVFINGSLDQFTEGEKVRKFLTGLGYKIIELSDGPLVDVGSILFV